MNTLVRAAWLGAVASVLLPFGTPAASEVDGKIPAYTPVPGTLSGALTSKGSDTLAYVMAFWGTEFKRLYPGVKFTMEFSGSGTAPPALMDGTANIAPMSRPMSEKEIGAFEKKFGYKPTEIRVALDALAVYVNKENPVKGLTVKQLDAIFSATRKCGYPNDIATWGHLGLTGEWAGRDIKLFGRSSLSGTHGYFKEHALCRGEYKGGIKTQPGPFEIMKSVALAKNGIGYADIGHRVDGVKAVPIARTESEPFIEPSEASTVNGSYPLTRFLYVYVNKQPGKPLGDIEREFIKMVLSHSGQRRVAEDGFVPLTAEMAAKERDKL